jgi:hypothetical protein
MEVDEGTEEDSSEIIDWLLREMKENRRIFARRREREENENEKEGRKKETKN